MKRSLAFLAAFALAVVGTMTGCDDGASSSSDSGSNPIVGVWSDSSEYSKTVLTIGADGSYTQVVSTSMGGVTTQQRTTGTWNANGDELSVVMNKLEANVDGKNWTPVSTQSSTMQGTYLVSGQILSLTIGGQETRYVQGTSGVVPAEVVVAPSFSPGTGTYSSAQTVEIVPANAGVEIYYTLDGTTPTPYSGEEYSAPIAISSTKTIKAIVVKGSKISPVASATITIKADNGGNGGGTDNALVGSWGISGEGYSQTVTFNSNGTFSGTSDMPEAAQYGFPRYSRVTGTWSVSGDNLTTVVTKEEESENGTTWTSVPVEEPTDIAKYTISGSILTITSEEGGRIQFTKK